ncbi:hypothetical protein [Streptomyces otsuchiensis]|uniref:hypothetical protein n=1 Tax=Streptomyces otsuchiensis TaxID=2681388 RepID=UPI001030ADF7|nr:hypothetical protein [Streptomyces otsuchiensis]
MTTTVRYSLIVLAGAVPAALGVGLEWQTLLTVLVAATAMSGTALILLWSEVSAPRGVQRYDAEPDQLPPTYKDVPTERPARRAQIDSVAVASSAPGFDFVVSATVWWRAAERVSEITQFNRDAANQNIAVSSVLSRIQAVTRREHPSRLDLTRHLLEAALAAPSEDVSGVVAAWAQDIKVTVDAEGLDQLRRMEEEVRETELWHREVKRERERRAYLADDVLASAGSAVVWWLARHNNDVENAVSMIGPLARISAAANNSDVAEPFHRLVTPTGQPAHDDDLLASMVSEEVIRRLHENERTDPGHGRQDSSPSDVLVDLLDSLGFQKDDDDRDLVVQRFVRLLRAHGKPVEADEMEADLAGHATVRGRPWEEAGGDTSATESVDSRVRQRPEQRAWSVDPSGDVSAPGSHPEPGAEPPAGEDDGMAGIPRQDGWRADGPVDPGRS